MRILTLIVWNILLFLMLVELMAVVAYFAKSGSVYYLDPPRRDPVPLQTASVVSYRLHPYLGFVLLPGPGDDATAAPRSSQNNMGFASPWNYPTERRPGELLVGVFGGSVASYVATYEHAHGLIAHRLAAVTGREPSQIRILNFAQGGYKQPQQVQILTYMLAIGQPLDAAINIDGFNEVALAQRNRLNGLAPHMPSIEHIRPLQEVTTIRGESERLEIMRQGRAAYADFARVYNRTWSNEGWESRFAAGFLVQYVRYRILERRFHALAGAVIDERRDDEASLSWLYLETPRQNLPTTEWQPVIDVWSRGARTFARVAEAADLPFILAVQPNQYYATARILSPAEQAIAINDASAYRELVAAGYPSLLEEAHRLEDEGLPIFDLTGAFDDVDEIVYVDDCCHYNDAGNRVVVAALADALASTWAGARAETRAAPRADVPTAEVLATGPGAAEALRSPPSAGDPRR